jgi:ribulose-5-phosphate 4-epimerase/fuculose-1-phosphate aldolase
MNEEQVRLEICRVGRSLFERGYAHSTSGNLSVRLGEEYLITPSDACLGFLRAGELAKLSADGVQMSGERASKASALHRAIYAADPEANCVLHTHSTSLVALTLSRNASEEADLLPPITPYFVMKVGHVPRIAYRRPGSEEAVDLVRAAILRMRSRGAPIRAVMLDRLGPVVWHRSLHEGMAALEELEETARLWRMLDPKPAPLPEEAIEELRRVFGASW